jgi:hypothetical protein
MSSFLIVLLSAGFVAVCIWLLHKNQRRRTLDTVERTAPLPALGNDALPDFGNTEAAAPVTADNWLARIKTLRDTGAATEALALCQAHYPRAQAFAQAAITLRQLLRECVEQHLPAEQLLGELFRTAALADLFRNGNPIRPADSAAAQAALQNTTFSWSAIGHNQLKLLNKSDVRMLEQAWGSPTAHRHVEDVLGMQWQAICHPQERHPQ